MSALYISLLASCCGALSNLFFRINSVRSQGGDCSNGYLCIYYLFSFILSLFVNSAIWSSKPSLTMITFGVLTGAVTFLVMLLTATALKKGPPGLTFAFQNASSVFPGLLFFLILGSNFGFTFTLLQFCGILLVVSGLFWGAKGESKGMSVSFKWLIPALGCCFFQIFAFVLIQGRCIFFECEKLGDAFQPFALEKLDDIWFLPSQFFTAFLLQLIVFLRDKRLPQSNELLFGVMAGTANFTSTFLLLLATKVAVSFEKAIIFPFFAAATIILCNIWASKFYREKFNLISNALCAMGIFLSLT